LDLATDIQRGDTKRGVNLTLRSLISLKKIKKINQKLKKEEESKKQVENKDKKAIINERAK
jgi:predicted phage-related endonuclease